MMIHYTTFNHKLWQIKSFDTIGYDKKKQMLIVKFFNGSRAVHHHVPEDVVFRFVIAHDKEAFYHQHILGQYAVPSP